MATRTTTAALAEPPNFLAQYRPLSVLWDGPEALYPSEQSARWAVRKLGAALGESQAVVIHRRALLIHPQRFAEVAERQAIAKFQARVNGK